MPKPTFLFLNVGGDLQSIHQRVAEEGFDCVSWYDPETLKGTKGRAGKGLIHCVDDLFDVVNDFRDHKDELVILIDDNSKGDLCDFLRGSGYRVIGSSRFSDLCEHDRFLGNELAQKVGLDIPKSYRFSDFQKARDFLSLQEKDAKFVFKGDGADLAGSSKTYLAKHVADMLWYVDWVEKDQSVHNYSVDSFELQEVVDGIEVDFGCWFDGRDFAPAIALDFEQKKIGGLGAAQGCMGQIVTYVRPNFAYAEKFRKLAPVLRRGNTGPNEWAINNIVGHADRKPYFLEWTPRLGWDSMFGELALLQDAGRGVAEFLIRLAYRKGFPDGFFPIGRYSAAVRLFSESIGTPGKDVCGKPLCYDPAHERDFWWYGTQMREDGRYELTDNPFGVATSCGDTPEEACERLYELVSPKGSSLTTPDLFYSTLIGDKVSETLDMLSRYGTVPRTAIDSGKSR